MKKLSINRCRISALNVKSRVKAGVLNAVLHGAGWKCAPHKTFWGATAGEARPVRCPIMGDILKALQRQYAAKLMVLPR